MGLMDQPGAGLFSLIADVFIDVGTAASNASLKRRAKRALRAAELENRLAEERARAQRRAWLAAVKRQARENRWAGDASEAEARAALAGKRPNPLDQRKFR
jgi:hypothetical protein